jgi:signal transduction histidine kinase
MGGESMISGHNRKVLEALDRMLDESIAGTFQARDFDESLLSKIESKMVRFLEQSRLRQDQIKIEREHVSSLISDISHQTKTPLANVTLYAQLLAEQDLTDQQISLANQISDGAGKLTFLIQSLVKTSRLESGIINIEPKPGNICDLISAAGVECESLAAAKNIKLSVDKNDASFMALFDSRWCAEALFNIIENAIKYTPENGSVAVSTTEYEMFIRIDVTDTGRGIREDDLPKVFSRFWRAEESADSPGVGIGLYLAREIIVSCGGYIKAISEVGKGSTFSVFFQNCKV